MAQHGSQYPRKTHWFKSGNTNDRSKDHLNSVLEETYPTLLDAAARQPGVRDESDAIELSLRIVDRITREYFRGKTWDVDDFLVVIKSYAYYEAKGFVAERQHSRHDSLDELTSRQGDGEIRVRQFEPADPSSPVDDAVVDADWVARVLAHPKLTDDDRSVLRLRYLAGWETDQIADFLSTNRNNVHQKIHRALGHVRDVTDGDYGIEEGGDR